MALVCSPSAGTGVHARCRSCRGKKRGDGAGGGVDFGPAVAGFELRMRPQIMHIVHVRSWRFAHASRRSITCSEVRCEKTSTMMACSSARASERRVLVEKRGSAARFGSLQNLIAKYCPFPFVLQAEHDALAVSGEERSVGIDRRMGGTGARRWCGAIESVVRVDCPSIRPCIPAWIGRCGTLGRSAAVDQSRENIGDGVHARRDVGDGASGFGRASGVPVMERKPDFALDQQIIGFLVAIRAVGSRSRKCRRRSARGCCVVQSFIRQARAGRSRRERDSAPERRLLREACEKMAAASGCLISSVRLSFERLHQTK